MRARLGADAVLGCAPRDYPVGAALQALYIEQVVPQQLFEHADTCRGGIHHPRADRGFILDWARHSAHTRKCLSPEKNCR